MCPSITLYLSVYILFQICFIFAIFACAFLLLARVQNAQNIYKQVKILLKIYIFKSQKKLIILKMLDRHLMLSTISKLNLL